MRTLKYILLFLIVSSCRTYNTFYSTTHTNLSSSKEVYRLDLSTYQEKIDLLIFKDLKVLNLSNLKNREELNVVLKSIPNPEFLETLILDNNHLQLLPTAILRFKNLNHISLNKNPSLNLEAAFKTLSKLPISFLNLQFNQLRSLPLSLTVLKELKEINLSNNQLKTKSVFNYLSKSSSLKTVWLRNNKLKSIGDEINKMNQLVNLYMENNQLFDLPANLQGLTSLRILNLSHNKFELLPIALQTMPSLILLHIDNCEIKKIPNSFTTKSTSIKGLVINNNHLSAQEIKKWQSVFKGFFLLIFEAYL